MVSALRFHISAEIKISRLCQTIGILCIIQHPRLHGSLLRCRVDTFSDTGLADIIHAGPEEIADQIGQFLHIAPVFLKFAGLALGTADDAVREQLMAGLIVIRKVIIAHHIPVLYKGSRILGPDLLPEGIVQVDETSAVGRHFLRQRFPEFLRVLVVEPLKERAERAADETGGIVLSHKSCQFRGNLITVFQPALLGELVSDGPEADRWMVAVPQQHRLQFLLPLLMEKGGKIQRVLFHVPGIEGLIDNDHAQLIADVQQLGRLGIVCQTQRVVAVLLVEANLPILGIIVGLRPENTVVVMNAAALQFQGLSV